MFEIPVDMCHFYFGCYRGLVIEAVTYAGEEGAITEDLRKTSAIEVKEREGRRSIGVRTFTPEEAIQGDLREAEDFRAGRKGQSQQSGRNERRQTSIQLPRD